MKKTTFTLVILCSITSLKAQINFEPGYYIDNENIRKEVFIKNIDWLENPSYFTYRISEASSKQQDISIKDVKEFGVNEGVVFVRKKVQLDQSSSAIGELSRNREAEFELAVIYLKKIVSGKGSLYYYLGNGEKRFFYSVGEEEPIPLVYKKYLARTNKIALNESYKQELKNNLECLNENEFNFGSLKYTIGSLARTFSAYNQCAGSKSIMHDTETRSNKNDDKVKIKVFGGARNNDLTVLNSNQKFEFLPKLGIQFGLEGEFVLNFNRNKWSIITSATYFSQKDEPSLDSDSTNRDYILDYSAIEVAIGGRHSLFINDISRVFVSGYYVLPLNINQKLESASGLYESYDSFESLTSFGAGLGYEMKNLSVELKYIGARSLLNGLRSSYTSLGVAVGYRFY